MFRKTYDSLSMAVHVELLADADKLCLKTWMQTDKMEYDFLLKYNDQFSNAWKLNALGSMDHDRPLNRYTLDEGLAGKKLYEEKEEDQVPIVVNHVERSLDIPHSPDHMEFPPEVQGIYHRYLPCGRIMGKAYLGSQLLPGIPKPYRAKYEKKLKDKFFVGNSYSWIDITDPSMSGGEKTDGSCWVIGIDYNGFTRPAFNATSREKDTKAHPLRSARQYGAPACLFVYQPFADTPLNECSITLKYNKGYGFSTNLDGWVDGTTELEMFSGSGKNKGKSYNYVGQLHEAFPNFTVTSGGESISADGTDTVKFKMTDSDGKAIKKEVTLYLESTGGYLPKTRLETDANGIGEFKVQALGLESGDMFKIKIGFRNFTGMTDVEYTVS